MIVKMYRYRNFDLHLEVITSGQSCLETPERSEEVFKNILV